MAQQTNTQMCNAWIFLNEDEPKVNGKRLLYTDPGSSYQRLIDKNVYQAVDILFLCFAVITPTQNGSFTLAMGNGDHPSGANPPTYTNQDYMNFIIRDARKNNPNIKICMTLLWGEQDEISQIFSSGTGTDEDKANAFAANLVDYLNQYALDGLDIDWEYPISLTPKAQMTTFLNAVGAAFRAETSRKLYLTLAPVTAENLDASVVNANVDFLSMQLYGGTSPDAYTSIGIDQNLLAYGAKFESSYQTAAEAYSGYQKGGYKIATQWRLNSDNFEFEQDNQVQLYKLIHGG